MGYVDLYRAALEDASIKKEIDRSKAWFVRSTTKGYRLIPNKKTNKQRPQ